MIWETLRIAIDSLIANKMRTILSMLGIIIGVGAVIAVISIGSGTQKQVTDEIISLGADVINIFSGTSKGQSGKISLNSSDVFTLELSDYINEISPSVKRVVPIAQGSGLIIKGNINIRTTVIGTRPDYIEVNNYNPVLGQFITSDDVKANSNIIILGSSLAGDIFGEENPLGKKIKFSYLNKDYLFTVMGVMQEKGGGLIGNFDTQAYIPITTYMKKISNSRFVTSYIAQANSSEETSEAAREIEFFLAKYLNDENQEKFELFNQDQILDVVSSVTGYFSIMLAGIAGISLLVGGIGIMNIMLVSVTERTKEIGIRKALGAKSKDIMSQFLIEALTLSGLGGVIGIIFGWISGLIAAKLGGMSMMMTCSTVLIAFCFAVIVGLFFGVYPAIKAAKMDPVEALRYE